MDLWVDNIAFLKVPYPLNLLSSVPFIKPQGLLPSLILSKTTMHLHTSLLSSPFSSIHHFPTKILLPPPSTTTITVPSSRYRLKPPHSRFFLPPRHRHANPNFKFVRSSMGEEFRYMEVEEAELLLATCITRTLPPALTLEQGLDKIKDAVEELKSKPCHAKSGMYRFQIAVSPGSKALGLFCSQDPSSGLFPQFFVCTEVEKPTTEFLSFSRTRGVFGIGAAFYIKRPYYSSSVEQIPSKRHQSVDSANLMAYGLLDGDTISTSVKYETQSLYMFIPQIELVEYEGSSILDATLAWDDSSLRVFEEAVDAIIYLSTALRQPITEEHPNKCVSAALRNFSMVGDQYAKMVFTDALSLRNLRPEHMELKDASLFSQFSLRLSATVATSNNMLDHLGDISSCLQEHSNINTLWASLIVEECYRLGLRYFCIAPGSRSSPLAIAASNHPQTSCIVCYDERSLAFHAIGYARGSCKPAVVITSSGTAVSNLLPAVVEAYQDFLPLLLLTADRPAELQDAGANQAINQVNHFGSFVRYSIGLPAPTDSISVRMVLTTIDSAVNLATSSPHGPVHINCPFREPLESTPKRWNQSCLKGIEFWTKSSEPFTNYIQGPNSFACGHVYGDMADVLQIIQGSKRGLLLIGALFKEDDIWAALFLAKHLCWPVVADILSGLRLRKYKTSISRLNEDILFVDHLDHSLLSAEVRHWVSADVIVQIGSRITSKRILQMLEDFSPCSYILVDNHPSRHDPSHIVTHRIWSPITLFVDCVLKSCIPHINHKWTSFLRSLVMTVAWEISFLIHSEQSLNEPYVAHIIPEALDSGSTMFLGNSMPIRDADMYGSSQEEASRGIDTLLVSGLPFHWIQVAGNRGASGIDGLLSTAVGFAVGHNKRVLCVIGDVSFLHDTNGLALLKQRISRKRMTILVINNHGGAIFSFLPIASIAERNTLNQYFYTSHDIGIQNLCIAHGVKHVEVHTKVELQNALIRSQQEEVDCVIEVESSIDANANFHCNLKKFACQAADHALSIISRLSVLDSCSRGSMSLKVLKLEFSRYRVELRAPLTSAPVNNGDSRYYREGFVLSLCLENGSIGYGEVAPLGARKDNLLDAEEQLHFLTHVIEGAALCFSLPLLKGSFSSWLWTTLGILPGSLLPSVRCGLEMAILNALATAEGSTMLNILHPLAPKEENAGRPLHVKICGLIDSNGTPAEVAYLAATLVEEGFTAIKLKVARRANPIEDAKVIQEIRRKVGCYIELRVDANRKWSFEEAVQFGSYVKDCKLQYIEEPVSNEDDIIKFCEESGLPVALDETIDSIQENPLQMLARFTHKGVVAVVIKPSFVGGFENAALIARWAQQQGKMTVISAAFESGLALSAYVQFSFYLEMQNAELCKMMNREPASAVAHGLGTYRWLKEDVITEPMCIRRNSCNGFTEASVVDAGRILHNFKINHNSVVRSYKAEEVRNYQLTMDIKGLTVSVNVYEVGEYTNNNVLVFLHGFLGTGEDWISIMKAMSVSSRCIAIDLPGHGGTKMHTKAGSHEAEGVDLSIKLIADMLHKLFLLLTPGQVTVVGYSMGARITLYMALRCYNVVKGVVIISGSPGLDDEVKRKVRSVKDDSRACALVSHGLNLFLEIWYSGELWKSLKGHPRFEQIVASRLKHDDVQALAKVLSDLSIGRQPSLWEDLEHNKLPLLLIVGERDEKFKKIAIAISSKIGKGRMRRDGLPKYPFAIVEIPNCGHAVHLENPLSVINSIREFHMRLKEFN